MVSPSPTSVPPDSSLRGPRRTVQSPRRYLPCLAATLLVAGIVWGLWPEPVRVETALATWGPLRVTVNEEGKTRIRERYLVSAPISGHLRRLELEVGAPVEAGITEIAVIDPLAAALLDARSRALAEARRDHAAANLDKARAAQQFASSELRRFQRLAQEQTISPQELETAQWRQTDASRSEAASESALRAAEAELAVFTSATTSPTNTVDRPFVVTAPASGRVLRVFEENSRVVAAGTPIVEIGDPTDLEVVIDVLSRDAAALKPGTPIELEQWGGAEPLRAQLRVVEPAAFTKVSALGVEEQRVNVIADLLTPPSKRSSLGDNFRFEARIVTWETNRTLKVPAGALFRRGDNWAAFVVAKKRAQERAVKVGQSSGTETEIIEGVEAGAEVIVYPGDRIRPGGRLRPMTY